MLTEVARARKKITDAAHRHTAKAKETRKRWRSRPDVKQKEAIRQSEYHKRPEAIVRAKERRDRPEAKAKILAYIKEYRTRPEAAARRKELHKFHNLKRYGLSVSEFDVLFTNQGGMCAICGTTHFTNRGPQVDHDHISGQVRGILCNSCNGGMGLFKDNTDIMEAAIAYLKSANAQSIPNPSSGIVE